MSSVMSLVRGHCSVTHRLLRQSPRVEPQFKWSGNRAVGRNQSVSKEGVKRVSRNGLEFTYGWIRGIMKGLGVQALMSWQVGFRSCRITEGRAQEERFCYTFLQRPKVSYSSLKS